MIETNTGSEYQFLKRVDQTIQELEQNPFLWWKKDQVYWQLPRYSYPPNHQKVIDYLSDTRDRIRNYLSKYFLHVNDLEIQHSYIKTKIKQKENKFVKSMIRHLGQIIEMVHGQKFNDTFRLNGAIIGGRYDQKRNNLICNRSDWIGFALYQLRNECSHYFDNFIFTFQSNQKYPTRNLKAFLSHLLAYLSTSELPVNSQNKQFVARASFGASWQQNKKMIKPDTFILWGDYFNWLNQIARSKTQRLLPQEQHEALRKHFQQYHYILNGNSFPPIEE
ncbi:MAG: hypothetical protein DWQ02_14575 [Bacteroidetes bacterium]|nr:MAG: hypothetical protein DWQ02_14575 [Bacteroidota bacterium]